MPRRDKAVLASSRRVGRGVVGRRGLWWGSPSWTLCGRRCGLRFWRLPPGLTTLGRDQPRRMQGVEVEVEVKVEGKVIALPTIVVKV